MRHMKQNGRRAGGAGGRAIGASTAVARGRPPPGIPRRDHRASRQQRMGVWLDWQEQWLDRSGGQALERPPLGQYHHAAGRQRQRQGLRRGQLTRQRLGVLWRGSKPGQSSRDRLSPAPAARAVGTAEELPGQLCDRLQRAQPPQRVGLRRHRRRARAGSRDLAPDPIGMGPGEHRESRAVQGKRRVSERHLGDGRGHHRPWPPDYAGGGPVEWERLGAAPFHQRRAAKTGQPDGGKRRRDQGILPR